MSQMYDLDMANVLLFRYIAALRYKPPSLCKKPLSGQTHKTAIKVADTCCKTLHRKELWSFMVQKNRKRLKTIL